MAAIGGAWLTQAVRVLIALALVTSVVSMIMAGPRVYAKMAEDGLFPKLFGVERGPPRAAVALQAALAILVIVTADLKLLLSYLGFTLWISSALTVASLFLLRRRLPQHSLPVWGYPYLPALYVGFTLVLAGIASAREPVQLVAALTTIASGSVAYRLLESWRRTQHG